MEEGTNADDMPIGGADTPKPGEEKAGDCTGAGEDRGGEEESPTEDKPKRGMVVVVCLGDRVFSSKWKTVFDAVV